MIEMLFGIYWKAGIMVTLLSISVTVMTPYIIYRAWKNNKEKFISRVTVPGTLTVMYSMLIGLTREAGINYVQLNEMFVFGMIPMLCVIWAIPYLDLADKSAINNLN